MHRTVTATKAQTRRRQLAFQLDRFDIPDWLNRALCVVVGFGHTPIRHYSIRCAWCDARMSESAPDTLPRSTPTKGEL